MKRKPDHKDVPEEREELGPGLTLGREGRAKLTEMAANPTRPDAAEGLLKSERAKLADTLVRRRSARNVAV